VRSAQLPDADPHFDLKSPLGATQQRRPEAGSNAGAAFQLLAYSDSGVLLATVFSVARATGQLTFGPNSGYKDGGLVVNDASSNAVKVVHTGNGATSFYANTADVLGFAIPAGASINWTPGGVPSSQTTSFTGQVKQNNISSTATDIVGALGAGTKGIARPTGIVRTGPTAGSLALRWAQGTSSAVPRPCLPTPL